MPCPSCDDLDLNNKRPAYRMGDFHTYTASLYETSLKCQICALLFRTVAHFAAEQNWRKLADPWCKIDISLGDAPDSPLSVICWEEPTWMDVELFTRPGLPTPFPQIKPVAVVGKTSDAPSCFRQIETWISECDASHADCRAPVEVALPTRLIDVNPTPDGLQPFLFEANGSAGRYAALSYVWGSSLPLTLTKATLETFKTSIPWSSIPKTLQDVMTITHRLGLRYLWVDALTIIQDDGDDWKTEAAKMASVYGNAHITIAATLSRNCQDGIFSPRTTSARHVRVWPLYPHEEPQEAKSLRDGEIYARSVWTKGISQYQLQKRGWTLQESILSRRVVHYTHNELLWYCRTSRATESRPAMKEVPRSSTKSSIDPLKPTLFPPLKDNSMVDAHTMHSLSKLWTEFVKDYSRRELTRESDKLPAISGIAKAFQASGMGRYHSGIWERDFLVGLAWYSASDLPWGPWKPTHVRPQEYRAPSWSWASVDGRVDWSCDEERWGHLRSPSAECRVVRVSDRELVLRGRVARGVLEKNLACLPDGEDSETQKSNLMGFGKLVVGKHESDSVRTDIIDTSLMHPAIDPPRGLVKTPLDVLCLRLGTQDPGKHTHWSTALVLAPSSHRPGAYERVGICSMLAAGCFEGTEEMELLIV